MRVRELKGGSVAMFVMAAAFHPMRVRELKVDTIRGAPGK